jgi:hypothetical protein
MGIVRFALRWPYTFYVLALLVLFLGHLAIHRSQYAGDGAARHHLQRVRAEYQRQRDQGPRGANTERPASYRIQARSQRLWPS